MLKTYLKQIPYLDSFYKSDKASGLDKYNKAKGTTNYGITEVVRERNEEKSTRARLVFYEGGDYFKVIFFNMDQARGKNFKKSKSIINGIESFISSITGSSKDPNKIVEDVGITKVTFDELRTHLTNVKGNVSLDGSTTQFPEYKKDAPKLCCIHL